MEYFFGLFFPAFLFVSVLRLFKIKWPLALLFLGTLSVAYVYLFNLIYCKFDDEFCKPDALSAVGYIFHWLYIVSMASFLELLLLKVFKVNSGG